MFVAAALKMFNKSKPDEKQILVAIPYEHYLGFDDETDGLINGEQSERQRKVRYPVGRSRSQNGNRRFFRRRSYARVEEQNLLI
ncbi:uncharacterized protein N7484_005873 [Penicillium longicatenatum]|uniref:uncharacterized protein n=1 Tax=Penicillium longicatenatum TaxID=1561947 RepID=UPI0025480C60|nr:uncharacterized protein N7484_005873 [Penicillium longicatenatum]KAJ5643366.1 hypothetical protein N7484_005873 [Penicillium longicatenatum]